MKKIAQFNIFFITIFYLFSLDSLAQNEKKQIFQDPKKNIFHEDKNNSKELLKQTSKFYIGLDASFQDSNFEGFEGKNPNDYYESQTSTVSFFSGYDNNDLYKIEAFYYKSNEKNQVSNSNKFSTYEFKTRTVGVDFKPYLNFDEKTHALLYLILGLNYNKIEAQEINQYSNYGASDNIISSETNAINSKINKFSPTFGVGVEYLFYKKFSLRFQYKRNFVDAKIKNSEVFNKVKNINSLSAGISFPF